MSFGFSIGDFIAIAQIAHGLRKEYAAAPSQLKNVSEEYVLLVLCCSLQFLLIALG